MKKTISLLLIIFVVTISATSKVNAEMGCPQTAMRADLNPKYGIIYHIFDPNTHSVQVSRLSADGFPGKLMASINTNEAVTEVAGSVATDGVNLALLMTNIKGDPARVSGTMWLEILNLNTGSQTSLSVTLAESYFVYYPSEGSVRGIKWQWIDNHQIIIDLLRRIFIIDVATRQIKEITPFEPPVDYSRSFQYSTYKSMIYFEKIRYANDTGVSLLAYDLLSKPSMSIAKIDADQLFYGIEGTKVIYSMDSSNSVVIRDLQSGKQKSLTRFTWYEYDLNGTYFFHSNLDYVSLHTRSRGPYGEERVYVIDYTSDDSEPQFSSLCVSGYTWYNLGVPSWNSQSPLYQYAMRLYNSQTIELYLYDAPNHTNYKMMSNEEYKMFNTGGRSIKIDGWSVDY